ncbi:MAG: D-aminoacyl-tRNA deacylase [Firmicutes bacterium]|nr:D-aminoacyl-tRNA deacylase [Bacillota bacterium]
MRVLLQRVKSAQVRVNRQIIGQIGSGLVVFLGVTPGDTVQTAERLADKVGKLRIFPQDSQHMSRSVQDISGSLLIVSQFTLYASVRHGRRPDFHLAAPGEVAETLYEKFIAACRNQGLFVATGQFGADMDVELINWGPVTLWLDSQELPG